MKRLFLVLAALVVMVGVASADPWLTNETPFDGIDTLTFTGDAFFPAEVPVVDGKVWVDLAGISAGSHAVEIAGCNVWGCGASYPLAFTKATPESLSGFKIIKKK